jgi:hypothetical protein
MRILVVIAVVLCAFAVAPAGAESPMREGKWEVTTQMQMPGVPIQLPAQRNTRCITRADTEDPERTLPSGSPDPDADCKVSDYQRDGKTVTWKLACTRPERMTGEGSIVVDGDRYDGTMKMTMSEGSMTMTYAGKRVGDCAP